MSGEARRNYKHATDLAWSFLSEDHGAAAATPGMLWEGHGALSRVARTRRRRAFGQTDGRFMGVAQSESLPGACTPTTSTYRAHVAHITSDPRRRQGCRATAQ